MKGPSAVEVKRLTIPMVAWVTVEVLNPDVTERVPRQTLCLGYSCDPTNPLRPTRSLFALQDHEVEVVFGRPISTFKQEPHFVVLTIAEKLDS